jgi:hypothetical protein
MFYHLNKKTLLWEKDWNKTWIAASLVIIFMIFSFLLGFNYKADKDDFLIRKLMPIAYELPNDPAESYLDSLFEDYRKRATIYLSQKKFEKSPIKPFMLSNNARHFYQETGVFLPVELALAQAQLESSMGTNGRSPKNNPFNIGEYDNGTVMYFDNTYSGVKSYYKYMTNSYLKCKPIDVLLKNFTNCNGYGYAHKDYGKQVSEIYFQIKKYIDREVEVK